MLWVGLIYLLVLQLLYTLYTRRFDFAVQRYPYLVLLTSIKEWWHHEVYTIDLKTLFVLGWQTSAIAALVIWYLNRREKPVYLLDFACWEPPDSWKVSPDQILECLRAQGAYTQESLDFMKRLLATSGVGPKTAWPPNITRCLEGLPRIKSPEAAREESKVVVFECVREVLERTKLQPKDIDILIINCSLFSPTPSLCAMVIHEFNMRSDILSYNLSGMVSDLHNSLNNCRVAVLVLSQLISPKIYLKVDQTH